MLLPRDPREHHIRPQRAFDRAFRVDRGKAIEQQAVGVVETPLLVERLRGNAGGKGREPGRRAGPVGQGQGVQRQALGGRQIELFERHRRLDREVEHRRYGMRSRPPHARLVPWQRMKGIEPAELPEPHPAERRGSVTATGCGVLPQIRNGNRERGNAVVLQGEAHRAHQLRCRTKLRRRSRRDIVELLLDLVDCLPGLMDPQRQHETPCQHQAPADLRQRGAGQALPRPAPPEHLEFWSPQRAVPRSSQRRVVARRGKWPRVRSGLLELGKTHRLGRPNGVAEATRTAIDNPADTSDAQKCKGLRELISDHSCQISVPWLTTSRQKAACCAGSFRSGGALCPVKFGKSRLISAARPRVRWRRRTGCRGTRRGGQCTSLDARPVA